MLYALLFPLADHIGAFNVFRYITFRTGGAVMTAMLISFLAGPALISWLKRKQREGQPIRARWSRGPSPHQEGHAHHGRRPDPAGPVDGDPAVGGPAQRLRLGRADRHAGLRPDRLRRRLPQADQALERRPVGQVEAAGSGRYRFHRGRRAGQSRRHAAGHRRGGAGVQGADHPSGLGLPPVWGAGDGRLLERGEPDRRVGWPRHRAGDDRRRQFRHDRLPRRQRDLRRLSGHPPRARHR